jgi:hypothetical protein
MGIKIHKPSLGPLRNVESYDPTSALEAAAPALQAAGQDPYVTTTNGQFYSHELTSHVASRHAADISEILCALETGKLAGEKIRIKDALMSKDFPQLFYAATEILMKDRIIPNRVITDNLFQTIPYQGSAVNVTIRTFGGVEVEEVPEAGEYPETFSAVSDQAYRLFIEIKKYGAKIAGTRELLESDNWGIFAYMLRSLGTELMNKKEWLASKMLNEKAGYVLMDNVTPSSSELGSCTGRGIDGAPNGAFGIDDMMNMLAWSQLRGYMIDTILVNPFAWTLWARDAEIREVMFGNGVTYIPNGSAGQGWDPMPWGSMGQPFGTFGGNGIPSMAPGSVSGGNWLTADPIYGKLGFAPHAWPNINPMGATYYTTPKHIDRPLKIIVTPLVPLVRSSSGAASGKYITNIIFAQSSKCGLILQKEAANMESWKDIEREIDFIKIRERYGMAMQEQGRAVAIAKNVVLDKTYAFDNVNSASLTAIDTSTARA